MFGILKKITRNEYEDVPVKLYEKGFGNDIQEKYELKLFNYLCMNQVSALKMLVTIESATVLDELLEESFVGVWYGVKIIDVDRNAEILRIPTFLKKDDGFISELEAKRRRVNLSLTNITAQYLLDVIKREYEFRKLDVTIEQNIQVNEHLLYYKNSDQYFI